jgi:hypothetical protein
MRKLSMVLGLLLVVTVDLAVVVEGPHPARAAAGDNLVLPGDEVTF